MKKILKYSSIIASLFILTISCRDEEAVRFPDLQSGVNARVVVHSDKLVMNLLDINNASTAFDIYSQNSDIKEITYRATFTDADFPTQKFPTVEVKKVPGSAFESGKVSNVTLTASELATALNLPGGAAYLSGGDFFTFFTSVELTDGRVFNSSNSAPSINSGTNPSFTTTWKLYVSCPFSVAEAVGSYTLVADPWGLATVADHQVEIVAGTKENQVIIKDAFGYAQKMDMIVNVDPVTGVATVDKQVTWDYDFWDPGPGYGLGSTEGSGFFFSCSGTLNLNLKPSVSAGSWSAQKIGYQKNP